MSSSGSDVSEEIASLDGNFVEFEKIKEAIDNIRDVQRKRPDEDSITAYLAKLGLLNDSVIVSHEIVSSTLRNLEENGLIINRPTKDGNSYLFAAK